MSLSGTILMPDSLPLLDSLLLLGSIPLFGSLWFYSVSEPHQGSLTNQEANQDPHFPSWLV